MPARGSFNNTVWDVSTACEALFVPRRSQIDPRVFLRNASLTTLTRELETQGIAMNLASDGENDIVAASWHKDITSPAGVFSLQLKRRRHDYGKLIKPGDLVVIFMDDAKDYSTGELFTGRLITIGIVDRPATIRHTTSEGVDTEIVTISGRDFGMILQETSTIHDPAFTEYEQDAFTAAYAQQLLTKKVVAQSPVENVLTLLNLFFNANATGSQLVGAQWALHGSFDEQRGQLTAVPLVSLLDITTFVQRPMFGYPVIDPISPVQAGNVWTLIDTYANRVVNELFIDVRDYTVAERDFLTYMNDVAAAHVAPEDAAVQREFVDSLKRGGVFRAAASETLRVSTSAARAEPVLALVHRQMPYDTDAFKRLPQVDVYPGEVTEIELGMAAHDVVNYFRLRTPSISPEYQEVVFGIHANINSVFKYGLRRLEPETIYNYVTRKGASDFDQGTANTTAFKDSFDYYIGLLTTWYATNDTMRAGSITMRLRPDIRIGQRLRLHATADPGAEPTYDFYVQSVAHTVMAEAGASRTVVTVVRGVQPEGTGLESNLRWGKNGPQLPPALNPYIVVSSVELTSAAQRGPTVTIHPYGVASTDAVGEESP